MAQLSIAAKLYITMTVVGILLLAVAIGNSYRHEKELILQMASNQAEALASSYFESVNTLMLAGAMAQQPLLHKKMLSQANVNAIHITRGDAISKMLGPGNFPQPQLDALTLRALQGETIEQLATIDGEPVLTRISPIIMTADHDGINCLMCHATNQEGDIGGTTRVEYSLAEADQRITAALWQQAGLLSLIFTGGILALAWVFRRAVVFPLKTLRTKLSDVACDLDLTQPFQTDNNDEIGQVSRSIGKMLKQFRNSIQVLADNSHQLNTTAEQVHQVAESTERSVVELKEGTDSVATTMLQVEASAGEVLQNAQFTASRSEQANQQAQQGSNESQQVTEQITSLVEAVKQASLSLEQLEERSDKVGTVVKVISDIAEQTNLLALNAAIEAARAGDQGRGFAVVASEVRELATRTHESTGEINTINEQLRQQKDQVVSTIERVIRSAEDSSTSIQSLTERLHSIAEQSVEISNLNSQIADAATEQNKALESINQHLVSIRDIADKSARDAATDNEISEQVVALSNKLEQIVDSYKL